MKWIKKKKPNKTAFTDSGQYWEQRYRAGKNSGSGSYGRLAEFKADVLNGFVADHDISSIVEWGCGDGNQLKLANYKSYIGLDVSLKAIDLCKSLFEADQSKKFLHIDASASNEKIEAISGQVAISLDVIYHLVEDDVFNGYMHQLFNSAKDYVIIYSSNHLNDSKQPHVKHRIFTDWVKENLSCWQLYKKIDNNYAFDKAAPEQTSRADFYFFKKI